MNWTGAAPETNAQVDMPGDDSRSLPVFDSFAGVGPTLVFLHYWGGSARTWWPVLTRLQGRAAIAFDARGWGRSRDLPGPYGLTRAADDVLAVLAASDTSRYVLVGHSMGGKVAQLVAARRPPGLLGMVLVAPGPARPPSHVTPAHRAELATAYDTEKSAAAALSQVLTATPLADEVASRVIVDSRASSGAARREWPLRGIAQDITESAAAITVPTLIVAGEKDPVEPPGVLTDHLQPYLATSTMTVLPGVGHLIPLEAPDALATLIADFADMAACA